MTCAESRPPSSRGFTLLEVLVALAIVTLALAALVRAGGQAGDVTGRMERKTLAHWVAMNQLDQLQATRSWPAPGEQSGLIAMAGENWQWRRRVVATQDPQVRRVELTVGRDGEPRLAEVTGFLARRVAAAGEASR